MSNKIRYAIGIDSNDISAIKVIKNPRRMSLCRIVSGEKFKTFTKRSTAASWADELNKTWQGSIPLGVLIVPVEMAKD